LKENEVSPRNRTRSQTCADQALKCVQDVVKERPENKTEYKARADAFPVMVMQAGLAQALGFMVAKSADKTAYGDFLNHLALLLGHKTGRDLHAYVISAPLAEYRRLTRETLAAAGHLKRFGQACLSDETDEKKDRQ
jgi:CRISPR-associated protein Cmr5